MNRKSRKTFNDLARGAVCVGQALEEVSVQAEAIAGVITGSRHERSQPQAHTDAHTQAY